MGGGRGAVGGRAGRARVLSARLDLEVARLGGEGVDRVGGRHEVAGLAAERLDVRVRPHPALTLHLLLRLPLARQKERRRHVPEGSLGLVGGPQPTQVGRTRRRDRRLVGGGERRRSAEELEHFVLNGASETRRAAACLRWVVWHRKGSFARSRVGARPRLLPTCCALSRSRRRPLPTVARTRRRQHSSRRAWRSLLPSGTVARATPPLFTIEVFDRPGRRHRASWRRGATWCT